MDQSQGTEDNIRTVTALYISDEKVHEGGVAIMICKQTEIGLMEWTQVSKWIITARFYSRFRRL